MKRLAAIGAVCTLGVVVSAQQAPPPAPQSETQAPQFRSSVELVRLDVSVLDRNRKPVRGLSAADFTILENGKPQDVAAFTAVEVPGPPEVPAGWMRDIAPDVRGNVATQQRRLFILAIDDATVENNPFAIKSVKEIARSVVNRLGPNDLASVVFTRDNENAQDFTADRARLLAAIDGFTVGFRGMGSGVPGEEDLWYLYSVGTLERAVDFMSDLPERRKSIIYIGEGLPFDISEVAGSVNALPSAAPGAASNVALQMRIKDQLSDVFDRAKRSNVTIYAADACGQRTPPAPGQQHPTCVPGLEVDYLAGLAAATGGRPILNTNDFEPGLTSLFEENASYYLLGFAPADPSHDGRFRRLEVKVNRPDVEVRTRSGYDAPRDLAPGRPAPSALTRAMAGVVPTSDLPMQVTAVPFAIPGKPDSVIALVVGFRQPIRQSAERTIENVDLQVAAYNADGRSFGNSRSRADVTIRAGAEGPAQYEVFGRIDVKPGRYQLRVAANVASMATPGSVYYDVTVPDFTAEPLSMSGLVLSATPRPVNAPKDALKDVMPIVPTTRRTFGKGDTVEAFGRVYQGKKVKIAPVTARLRVRNASDEVVVERSQEIASGRFGSSRAADVRFDVPLAELPPGAYLLSIETWASAVSARRDIRFQVAK